MCYFCKQSYLKYIDNEKEVFMGDGRHPYLLPWNVKFDIVLESRRPCTAPYGYRDTDGRLVVR